MTDPQKDCRPESSAEATEDDDRPNDWIFPDLDFIIPILAVMMQIPRYLHGFRTPSPLLCHGGQALDSPKR